MSKSTPGPQHCATTDTMLPSSTNLLPTSFYLAGSSSNFVSMQLNPSSLVAYTKLERTHASSINRMHSVLFAAAFISFLESIIFIVVTKLNFHSDANNLPRIYTVVKMAFIILVFLLTVTLSIVYTIRVARLPAETRVAQQLHCIFLVWSFAAYANPAFAVLDVFPPDETQISKFLAYFAVPYNLSSTVFNLLFFFYTWSQAESYGILDAQSLKGLPKKFYLKKLLTLIPYAIARIIIGVFTLSFFPPFPLISLLAASERFRRYKKYSQFYLILLLTVFEFMYCVWGIFLTARTYRRLRKEDYLRTRMQQLGFRIYLFRSLTVFITLYICETMVMYSLPSSELLYIGQIFGIFLFDSNINEISTLFLSTVYVFLECWCNLPANAQGFRGWLSDTENAQEPQSNDILLSFRVIEPKPCAITRPGCFVLETAISMFNFSWLVYSYRGGSLKRISTPELYGESNFMFVCDIFDVITETQCVIYEAIDRIIVSFKGTTSIQDWKTDLHATYELATIAFPDAQIEKFSITHSDWSRSEIHTGFVLAFISVKKRIYETITKLLDENSARTLFFTGHSLGGSLAYLTALGIRLECGLPQEMNGGAVFVYTFGAPKIGNYAFEQAYNKVLKGTWSVVFNGDVICHLPLSIFGFRNLGNKALLTEGGDLFIDPSFGELNLSFFTRPSLEHHKKKNYGDALSKLGRKNALRRAKLGIWMFHEAASEQSIAHETTVDMIQSLEEDNLSTMTWVSEFEVPMQGHLLNSAHRMVSDFEAALE